MTAFPSAVATIAANLGGVTNGAATTLNGAINGAVTTITVVDTTSFSSAGYALIDTEIFSYTGKTLTTFTGVTRGVDGTVAASHATTAPVQGYVMAAHVTNLQNELIATQQNISDRLGLSAVQNLAPNGSAALPSFAFANSATTGLYRQGSNVMSVSIAGTEAIRLGTNAFAFGDTFTGLTGVYLQMRMSTAAAASLANIAVINDFNSSSFSASAAFIAQVGGATTAGDAYTRYTVASVTNWSIGLDNSDSDNFKLSASATLGTNDYLTVTTAGAFTFGGNITVSKATPALIATDTGTSFAYLKLANTNSSLYIGQESSAGGDSLAGSSAYAGIINMANTNALQFGTSNVLRFQITSLGIPWVTQGTSDDTTYSVLKTSAGGSSGASTCLHLQFTTTGVTTAKKILDVSQYCDLVLVTGSDGGGNIFGDLVFAGFGASPTAVVSKNSSGSPAARTYSQVSGDLKVAMASGTYSVAAYALELRTR